MRRRKSWKDQMMRSLMVDEEGGEFETKFRYFRLFFIIVRPFVYYLSVPFAQNFKIKCILA